MAERFSQKDVKRALDRLLALQSNPAERAEYAAELLARTSHPEVVLAAFRALANNPDGGAREVILGRLVALDGHPKLDPGGSLRAAGIAALAPIAISDDRDKLLAWTRRLERTMQDDSRGGAIRAAALPALARLDAARAVFEAIRLLGDTANTSQFTAEPAVTAARVLAELGETAALYTFIYSAPRANDDVLAEAFRGLESFPPEIIDDIVQTFSGGDDARLSDPGEAGLMDLVLSSSPRPTTEAYVRRVLASERYDLYGFAVTTLAANREPGWLGILAKEAEVTSDRSKLYMLSRALPLAAKDAGIAAAIMMVSARRDAQRDGPVAEDEKVEDD
jgi:hypothetical protein